MAGITQKVHHEIKALLESSLYFALWVFGLLLVKILILNEYQISFTGWSTAFVGVLILAKVVLILEHVPLGAWSRTQPAWLEVLLRTVLYAIGVFVVMILEKAFEGRHEHGEFGNALMALFRHADMPHVWANTICIFGALLGYNILAVIRKQLGPGGLIKMFLTPVSGERPLSDQKVE